MSKLTNMLAVAVGGFILAAALAPTTANAFTPRHDQINAGPASHLPPAPDQRPTETMRISQAPKALVFIVPNFFS